MTTTWKAPAPADVLLADGSIAVVRPLRPGDAGWFTLVVAVAAMVTAAAALARGEAASAAASQPA